MKRRGFTLIELMICIAIVGILAAILIPMVRDGDVSLVKANCLQFGYSQQQTWGDVVYCIRTLNGTDEVVPLRDLKARQQQIEREP